MAQIEYTHPDTLPVGTEARSGKMKHCRSCFRKDYHFPVATSPFVYGFLLVATLGLIIVIRPSRCVCCGKTRIF